MWNIVTIGDGNYLVDVTNSDDGTAGERGGLFMAWDRIMEALKTVMYLILFIMMMLLLLPMTDGRKICMEQEITLF